MADVEQGTYSYSNKRESMHDQCADMTSVHPGHDPTYWDAHQTLYSSRTDLLKQQHADIATLATAQTRIGTEHNGTYAAVEPTRIKKHAASTLTAGPCPPIEHPTWVVRLQHRCTS